MYMHERQFLIGPRSAPLDTWIHHDLDGGFVLSRSPLLRYEGGTLGEMLGGDHRVASGRFVRLGRQVELDAGGTLGVLYRRIGDELWLSSSPELLRTLPPELPAPSSRLGWGTPPETFPPPLTGLQGVYRLMPTQILDLETGELIRRPVLSGTAPSTYESALDELEELLRGAVRSAAERFSQVWVPLTGGSDSRVVLAACHSEGVEVTTYTFDYELSTGPLAPPVTALRMSGSSWNFDGDLRVDGQTVTSSAAFWGSWSLGALWRV
jgi:hypothetical protein